MGVKERRLKREELYKFVGSKSMTGQVHTPRKIAHEMVEMLPEEVWSSNTTFLDPACKSGVFLLEILNKLMSCSDLVKRFQDELEREQHILREQLYGIATDDMAEMFVKRLLYLDLDIDNVKYVKDFVKKEFNSEMKFDVVIGNPPYNDDFNAGGGNAKRAMALYPLFITKSQLMGRYVAMITPTRWYTQPEFSELRSKMMNGRLVSLKDYLKSSDCFNDVNIAGGVCYWLWDREYNGATKFSNDTDAWEVDLREYDIIVRYKYACSVVKKLGNTSEMFDSLVHGTDLFGVKRDKFGDIKEKTDTNNILLWHSRGEYEYIKSSDVTKNSESVGKFKLCTEYMNGSSDTVLKNLNVLDKNEICDLSFIVIAVSDNIDTIKNILSYCKTKFVRFLIKATLTNTTVTRNNYCLVPLQDFSKSWTDKEIYEKYSLSEEEINYIESTIKAL